jgi:hypothetical protein
MSRIYVKNLPRLKLSDLLRRRKMTLRALLDELGITTYEGLVARCERMGVLEPTREEFLVVMPEVVNSPPEGVIVLEPAPVVEDVVVVTEPGQLDDILVGVSGSQDGTTKKARKKKESQLGN